MPQKSLTSVQVLTMLAQTPPRIAALTAGLLPTQLHTAPNPDAWSANDLLAHLRACADVWGNCIEVIVAQDMPAIRAVNPTTWINTTDYLEQDFHRSLHAFTMQRSDLLAALESLAVEDWSRAATVRGAGKVLERTVLFYAQWLASHERTHFKQLERIANTMRV